MTLKKIFTLLMFIFVTAWCFGQKQMTAYDTKWQHVDSLIEKGGLVKTALSEVNSIYAAAKKAGNSTQVIKALIYRITLNEQLSEQPLKDNIEAIEKEIATAAPVAKAILHSLLAGIYHDYLDANRWRLYNRTPAAGAKTEAVDTWSLSDLSAQIDSNYRLSIAEKNLLQQTPLAPFDPLIDKGNARALRPTLFDLLAHRALQYYKSDERSLTRPADAFELSDSAAFAEASVFARHTFETTDTVSTHYRALQIYQQLVAFHLRDQQPAALIDADLGRLEFANDYAVMPGKDLLYRSSLQSLASRYPGEPGAVQALFLVAQSHLNAANSYDPLGDTSKRYERVRAKEICETALRSRDSSEGKTNCANLLQQILQQQLSTEAEKVNTAREPFRVLANYRNTGAVYAKILRLDRQTKQSLGTETWTDKYWQQLAQLPAVDTFSYRLPDTKDYQLHRVEIKVDGLAPGEYGLLVSGGKDFTPGAHAMALQRLYVSDIAYVNAGTRYYVLDRNSGAPLAGAKIRVWKQAPRNRPQGEALIAAGNYTADADGFFELKQASARQSYDPYRLEIQHGQDRLFTDDNVYTVVYGEPRSSTGHRSFLFTDRAIYRPGQTVFFKGIVLSRDSGEAAVVPKYRTTVKLFNANGEEVDSIAVITNPYGSYTGKFTLPSGVLNGEFSIMAKEEESRISIRVEEYKRPRFAVELKPPHGVYRLNDTVRIEGHAKAFAGNAIGGAAVVYRVVRKTTFPIWQQYSSRFWPPQRDAAEIAHGTVETMADGSFQIAFPALPDRELPKERHPIFHYELTADITDLAGETHAGQLMVSVGYQALQLQLDVPAKQRLDSFNTYRLSATNFSGVPETANVRVTIYSLDAPGKLFRDRYWQQPDQFVFSRAEYYHQFPLDLYDDENDFTTWPRNKKVTETSVTAGKDSAYPVARQALLPGWYAIEAVAVDRFGDTVKAVRYTQLYNHKIVSPLATASIDLERSSAAPGAAIQYRLQSNMDPLHLVRQVSIDGHEKRDLIEPKSINKDFRTQMPLAGEISISFITVRNNRTYSDSRTVTVNDPSKGLFIDYLSFRDKTQPGSKEVWKVKIRGAGGDAKAAELLTTMYDASLDQFVVHSWRKPELSEAKIAPPAWTGYQVFGGAGSDNREQQLALQNTVAREYDRLKAPERRRQYMMRESMMGVKRANVAVDAEAKLQSAAPGPAVADSAADQESKEARGGNEQPVMYRKDLKETAFFFPDLRTDSSGNVEFSFTSPESLTTWKWLLLAHTADAGFALSEKEMVTSKPLMVQPNAPRFLREGDHIDFRAGVVSMTDSLLSGKVRLQLIDPSTGEEVNTLFSNAAPEQSFTAAAGQTVPVKFSMIIPAGYQRPVTWRILATSGTAGTGRTLSDGEEGLLPVISNRILVTESLTLPMRGNQVREFRFDKLLNSAGSKTLEHQALTIAYTANPAWYAVQALPYLSETTEENAEAVFNRYYANLLAAKVSGSSKAFRDIIDRWKNTDSSALLSALQKNEELKAVLLQETPWVLEAKSETQQKKNIALLFDTQRMAQETSAALQKLIDMQSPQGAFMWFKGGPSDRYMTQYILAGVGRLQTLNALPKDDAALQQMIRNGIAWLDEEITKEYALLKKNNKKLPVAQVSALAIHYLYVRSLFSGIGVPGTAFTAYNYFRNQAKQGWIKQSSFLRGMIALALFRTGEKQIAGKIMAALKESAIDNAELGTYWKDVNSGYYWQQAPVETQSLLVEAFSTIGGDTAMINGINTWLLKNKQTNSWKTTKATADACYALLLQGTKWTEVTPAVKIELGQRSIAPDGGAEAGTGYFKTRIDGEEVKPAMGNIRVSISGADKASGQPSWGAVYWQYFEDLGKISAAATPLSVEKQLFVQTNTDRGPQLQPLPDNKQIRLGDKIKVRVVLRADRDMEYVHLKDMRGACLEPVNVLSAYRYQGGLGYYESTGDVATNFYFSYLRKGTYVFEYDLFASQTGSFSNGICTAQCLYAPEFSSHSAGIHLNVIGK